MVPRGAQRQRCCCWNPAAAIALSSGQRLPVAVANPRDDPLRQRARIAVTTTTTTRGIRRHACGFHIHRPRLRIERSAANGRQSTATQFPDVWRILPVRPRIAQVLRTRVSIFVVVVVSFFLPVWMMRCGRAMHSLIRLPWAFWKPSTLFGLFIIYDSIYRGRQGHTAQWIYGPLT